MAARIEESDHLAAAMKWIPGVFLVYQASEQQIGSIEMLGGVSWKADIWLVPKSTSSICQPLPDAHLTPDRVR